MSKDLRRLDFFGSFLCQDKNEQSFIALKNLILKLRNRQKENQLEQAHSKQLHYTSARVSSTQCNKVLGYREPPGRVSRSCGMYQDLFTEKTESSPVIIPLYPMIPLRFAVALI